MEPSSLTLAVGESHEIQLASRGASGLQLLFALDPAGIVAVTRREATPAERGAPNANVGGGMPAYFMLQGLKSGRAKVSFFERPAPGRGGEDIPVATYQVVVRE
ncbi:MAG: hypothetical protein ACRYFZ_02605 [Janthinobacterium lividum]